MSPRTDRPMVDAHDTHQLIKELAALGWSRKVLSRDLGKSPSYIKNVMSCDEIPQDTADLIRDAHRRLRTTIGPCSRARAVAANQGWTPPPRRLPITRSTPMGAARVAVLTHELRGVAPQWEGTPACAGMQDLFFSERGEDIAFAKQICEGCALRVECLQTAMANNEQFGVWAGTTPSERGAMVRRARQRRAAAA